MLSQLARGIGSLLFPAVCQACRAPAEAGSLSPLCSACFGLLPRCIPSRSPGSQALDGAVTPFLHKGACRDLILALKYRGRTSLVPFLADEMAEELLRGSGCIPADRILPVPLHASRLRERTFNQAELLAQALSERLRLPCDMDLLIRCRPTRPQAELTRAERADNVRGAFDLHRSACLKGQRLLLVDDVLTTGFTARACAGLLKSAGARSVTAVAAARQPI